MSRYGEDYWDFTRERNDSAAIASSMPEFTTAFRELDRLIEKARRFYQSGDYEEVVLNAYKIKELYRLCLIDEYKRQGRYTFSPNLRAKIDRDLDSLDYWWDEGIVAFQKIKIGPEIAKAALALSEEIRDYLTSYVGYRSGASLSSEVSNNLFRRAPPDRNRVAEVRRTYPVKRGRLKIQDEDLLYYGSPSIVGCTIEHRGILLLVGVLLFGSFFISGSSEANLLATILRAVAAVLFLYVISRIAIAIYSERYAITEQDIHVEKGLFFKRTSSIPLSAVAKHKKQQSLLGRLLKTGDLVLQTRNGYRTTFNGVYDPDEIAELVAELRNNKMFHQD